MFRRVRHANGPKGVVLGDDMGLGKTVQIIALFSALLKKTGAFFGPGGFRSADVAVHMAVRKYRYCTAEMFANKAFLGR